MLDLFDLADLCGFDSQAGGVEWKGWSEWCGIFREKEWDVLGYVRDAKRFWHVGGGGVSHLSALACVRQNGEGVTLMMWGWT